MRKIATNKKPVFVQANSNSSQGHVLHYITSVCVVFRLPTLYFWLAGKIETKQVVNRMSKWVEGGGSWKGHESGQAVFIFLTTSPLVLARFAHEFRGFASRAPGSIKPPCYAGYDTIRKQAENKNFDRPCIFWLVQGFWYYKSCWSTEKVYKQWIFSKIALIPPWILEKGFYYQGAKLLNEFPIRLNFENSI